MDSEYIEYIKKKERRNIIDNIVGSIVGVGETNHDNDVLKNLDFLNFVLTPIIDKLITNCEYEGNESSLVEIKEKSTSILKDLEVAVKERI